MEAMKEQMTMMMEEMMNMRKMMEDNTATVVAASTATEMDLIHLFDFNQMNRLVSDVVGQGGEAVKNACGPHHVQVQSKYSFPPYGCLLIIHRPLLYTLQVRISTILHLYSLRINNPNLIMHMFLNPWGKHMKFPKTTFWPSSGFI